MANPVIYLLPGLMCDEAVWETQRQALESMAEVRIPVFRGFDSLQEMARSVLEQAPEMFSVAGHSMGGRVALELVHMAPDRVDGLALLNTGAHPRKPEEPQKRQVLLDLAATEGLEAVAKVWIPPMLHPDRSSDEQLVKEIRDMILRNSIEDFRGQVKALLNRSDQFPYLPAITQNVLLVTGDGDGWSPVDQHEQMLHKLPDAKLEIIANAGHMSTMEQPRAVADVMATWFRELHA